MSRRSIKEYILRKRDDYLGETPRGKSRMLDETCRTVRLTRKYVIKLLGGSTRNGTSAFHSHRGEELRWLAKRLH